MTVKEYLGQAYYIDREIDSKIEVMDRLNALATKATSTISDMPGSATRNVHKREDVIAKIIDLDAVITSRIDYLVDLKKEIYSVINNVDDPDCIFLLEQRYICFKKWEDIAVMMNCDVRTIYRLHGISLKKVEKFVPCQ